MISEGYVGQIFDTVLTAGFEISAAEMFWLDRPSAEVKNVLFRNSLKYTKELYPNTINSLNNTQMVLALLLR